MDAEAARWEAAKKAENLKREWRIEKEEGRRKKEEGRRKEIHSPSRPLAIAPRGGNFCGPLR